jgi:hypothetical protein
MREVPPVCPPNEVSRDHDLQSEKMAQKWIQVMENQFLSPTSGFQRRFSALRERHPEDDLEFAHVFDEMLRGCGELASLYRQLLGIDTPSWRSAIRRELEQRKE